MSEVISLKFPLCFVASRAEKEANNGLDALLELADTNPTLIDEYFINNAILKLEYLRYRAQQVQEKRVGVFA